MDGKIGRKLPDEATDTDVLNDSGVHARRDHGAEIFFGLLPLVLEYKRVEGDVTLNAATVKEFHEAREIGFSKIVRPHAGVEFFETEIDGVGAILDGGFGALPIAG